MLTPAQREARRLGGLARARQFTPDHQRRAQAGRTSASLAAAGKLGFERLVEKVGKEQAILKVRERADQANAQRRRREPTGPEQRVIALLAALGAPEYEREYEEPWAWEQSLFLDFAWPGTRRCIEVDGYHHRDPARAALDAEKREALRAGGWDVLVLADTELDQAATAIAAFLGLEAPCG